MSANRLGVRFAIPLLVIAVMLAVCAGSASADKGIISMFGAYGTQGGDSQGPDGGVAVNQDGAGGVSPGDLYIADVGGNRVQELSPSGSFIRAFGLGVGGPGVDVCTEATACTAGTASEAAGSINQPLGVAIDSATGNVFVSDSGNNRVDVFSATGEFEGAFGWNVRAIGGAEELQFCTASSGCKSGTTGDGAGQLIHKDASSNVVESGDLAVSPLNGHLIVAHGARVDEYAPELTGGEVTGVSFVRGYGWGVVNGADEFQICTVTCGGAHVKQCGDLLSNPQPGLFAGSPRGITVDSEGHVYVAGRSTMGIQKFDSDGHPLGYLFPPTTDECQEHVQTGFLGVTFDETANTVLAFRNGHMFEYSATGQQLEDVSLGGFTLINALAFSQGSQVAYIAAQGFDSKANHSFGAVMKYGTVVPPLVGIEAPTEVAGTSATFHGNINPTGLATKYQFEYSTDGVNWIAAGGEQELPADSSEHSVSQKVEVLEALTNYRVRLVAKKVFNGGEASAETTFTTLEAPPVLSMPGVRGVTDSSASIEGKVNTENDATKYWFECVSQADFEEEEYAGAFDAPPGGETLEASGKPTSVSQMLTNLEPNTAYHCRLAAENSTGNATSPEVLFQTYGSQGLALPDGRAYEQVTPVDKNGTDANGVETSLKAALDGDAVSYFITGGGGEAEGGQDFPTYFADRGSDSWSSHSLLPSSSLGDHVRLKGWSEDLKRDYVLVWESGSPATFYEYLPASGVLREIATGLEPFKGAAYAGESADGSRLLFESKTALAPEAIEGVWNLYVWDRENGSLSLASVLPDGSSPPSGAFAGPYAWADPDPKAGGAFGAEIYGQDMHVISRDGEEAFFTTSNVNQLYVRKGIATSSPSTTQVSASQKTNGSGPNGRDPLGPKKAAFMEATPDGRYVFFTSPEQLTNDATTGSSDQGNDLYRYDTESGQLIDLVPDATDSAGADVQGTLGSSADGSYVYFVANGVLAEHAVAGTCQSSPVTGWMKIDGGLCNLYVWHDGSVAFISQINGKLYSALNWMPGHRTGGAEKPLRASRVSSDGKTLLFSSLLSVTSYDSKGNLEFYRYNTEEGLECVSCNPTGAPPVGAASIQSMEPGFTRPEGPNSFLLHNLSEDGNRVFFESVDKLVASDVNGENSCAGETSEDRACQDVYEWEADGTGSCESRAQNGGCLYLISTGESNEPSYFDDASADGSNVFFFTRQPLVRQDADHLYDVYDARVGGGIASQNQPPPTRCEGEACKPGASTSPGSRSPGSASFSGPPNPQAGHPKNVHKKHKKRHRHRHRAKKGSKRHAKSRSHR